MNIIRRPLSGFFLKNHCLLKPQAFNGGSKTVGNSTLRLLTTCNLNFFNRNIANNASVNSIIRKQSLHTSSRTAFHRTAFCKNAPANGDIATKIKSKYPVNSSNTVGYWLLGVSGLVFGIVILGGLTRLTESGLSITEWRPITGSIPPLTHEDWVAEFEKYKESPEFKQLNSHITLDEYKFIFFMEWSHRLVARVIGLTLVLPAIYFAVRKKTSAHMNRRFIGLGLLLALQGAVGWWMVYSGLDQKQLDDRKSKPTVSQYRLTTHLGAAFLLYMGMLWTSFEILKENSWIKSPEKAAQTIAKLESPLLKPFRRLSLFLVALTFVTAMSGGMVAGLDAGLIYNTFPTMSNGGEQWFPNNNELFSPVFARKEDQSDMIWRNLFENPTTVQLVHRILAISTFTTVFAAHMYVNRHKALLPKRAVQLMHYTMGMVTLQAALGISTLIYLVPIPLAAAHQAGAMGLLTLCLAFAAGLRKPRFPIRLLIRKLRAQLAQAKQGKILN